MKIGLISPVGVTTSDVLLSHIFDENRDLNNYIQSFTRAISSGLLVIASLTPEDIEIKLIDDNFDRIDYDERFDLIGISAMTHQSTRAYEIANEFKKRGVPVVIGGMHATVLPNEVKEHCDSVFIGEAEDTWPLFIQDFKNGRISEFYKSERLIDMSKTPIPRYDLLKKEKYKVIWLQTSRGCPHDCEFCGSSRVYGYKYRHKTIDQVIDELHVIHAIWPDARINFADDNLLVDRSFSKKLFTELKKFNFRWFAQTDISIAEDEEFLKELKDAGCTTLFIGFESISENSLMTINKNKWKLKHLKNYPQAIENVQSKGIGIVGAFIIGLDGDTKETFQELIDFIVNNRIYTPQITILTPLPGTRLYERLENENRLLHIPWNHYTFTEVSYIPKNMSAVELQNGLYEIYEKVYNKEVRAAVLRHFKNIFKEIN
ncbi:MAG: B12-binding domain-containing radical SAM protein [Spirochaetes bacterium]|nr:B12-binding domain-containing radical SAM protein [Spirochaetota bacterium]